MTLKMYWQSFKYHYIEPVINYWNWYTRKDAIHVGDYYSDCGYIPRRAVKADPYDLVGISLIDGSEGCCSVHYCGPDKLTKEQAEAIAKTGPLDPEHKQRLGDGWVVLEFKGNKYLYRRRGYGDHATEVMAPFTTNTPNN